MLLAQEYIHKIMFVNIAHIGDIVVSTPVTRALKAAYPHAEIDVLTSPLSKKAVQHNPFISNIFVYDIDNWQQDRIKLLKLVQLLQRQKYDLALTPCYGTVDPMMVWLCGAKYRAGFDTYGGVKFLTHVTHLPGIDDIRHETEKQLEVLTVLDIAAQDSSIVFCYTDKEAASLHQKLELTHKKPLVLLCPFSSDSQKDWPITNCTALLQQLTKLAHCYLIGSHTALPKLRQINAAANNIAEVLAGSLTLGELAALINKADLFITVDTGPLHIAQAFQTPVLALFGPTDPRVWGPRGCHDFILQTLKKCAPCWHKPDSLKNSCVKNECMEQISAADVLQTALKMLKQNC